MKTLGNIMMPLVPVIFVLSLWLCYEYKTPCFLIGGFAYALLAMIVYFKRDIDDMLTLEDEECDPEY